MIVKLRRKNPRYPDLTVGHHMLWSVLGPMNFGFWRTPVGHTSILLTFSRYSTIMSRQTGLASSAKTVSVMPYPTPLNKPGFFEDFFDGKPKAVGTFWRVVNRRLATASEVHSIH
jgi:hypothetical protein